MSKQPMIVTGYYVMTWRAGRYQSIAWYADHCAAYQQAQAILCSGQWSGMPPTIKPSLGLLHTESKDK